MTAVSAARFRYDRPAMTAKNDFKQRTLSGLGWSLMGQAGRQRMQNEFSIATMADRHIAMYESILNG